MHIYNPNKQLFAEIENFLGYYYSNINLPICIYQPLQIGEQILYNTEQLTRPDVLDFAKIQKNNSNIIEIWDYSQANIKIWQSLGAYNVKHVPLKLWPEYKQEIESYNLSKTYLYDVGFCGWISGNRRMSMISKIKNSNIRLKTIDGIYGRERDTILAKCKIILNIHFDTHYNIFEQLRCFPWLDTGKTVVSENSLDNDQRCVNVEYEDIPKTLEYLLNQ
jgi:hypothetical protein